MRPGLVSISFRAHLARSVAAAAASAGLECIEWGGDIHVPHGDIAAAREVAGMTADYGLSVSAYGSYLRLGARNVDGATVAGAPETPSHRQVLDTAAALGAPLVRVWPGWKGSGDTSQAERTAIVLEALELAEAAGQAGLKIAFEYHARTLTDTPDSARRLFAETRHPAVATLWQPTNGAEAEYCLDTLDIALPYLANVHVFHWGADSSHRFALAEGDARWRRYIARIREAGKNPDCLLEFVPGDDITLLPREAESLRRLIGRPEA